jgi:hypothetical protein
VRMFLASATLCSGLIVGNWYLSYPGFAPMASAQLISAPPLAATNPASPLTATVSSRQAPEPALQADASSENQTWPDATVSRAVAPKPLEAAPPEEQDARVPETNSNSALVVEEPFPATSLDGRMSLGGVPPDGEEQKSAAPPRRAARKDESFFIHPLGQL